MKGAWPRVTGSVMYEFTARHAMPRLGGASAQAHPHYYCVRFGWTHEIQPTEGFTHEYSEQRKRFAELIGKLSGAYLNDILPLQPSAEVLALWLLAHTEPAYCDHVVVQCYDGYEARADRSLQRSEWMRYLTGAGPRP